MTTPRATENAIRGIINTGRRVGAIYRSELRNLSKWPAEFRKICCGKLWSLPALCTRNYVMCRLCKYKWLLLLLLLLLLCSNCWYYGMLKPVQLALCPVHDIWHDVLQYQLAGDTWLLGGSCWLSWCWKVITDISSTRWNGKASWQRDCEGTATNPWRLCCEIV